MERVGRGDISSRCQKIRKGEKIDDKQKGYLSCQTLAKHEIFVPRKKKDGDTLNPSDLISWQKERHLISFASYGIRFS